MHSLRSPHWAIFIGIWIAFQETLNTRFNRMQKTPQVEIDLSEGCFRIIAWPLTSDMIYGYF